jgi:predicted nucleotidyltransferase component of viral defense system
LRASALTDLVAEKLRAMLQQSVRDRVRRQDAYDLYHLLNRRELRSAAGRREVLASLQAKAAARNLPVGIESLRDAEIRRRSQAEYAQLTGEISGDLPEFEVVYATVQQYFESLPWGTGDRTERNR